MSFRAKLENGSYIVSDYPISSEVTGAINRAKRQSDYQEERHDALRSAPLRSVGYGISVVTADDADGYFKSWQYTRDARQFVDDECARYQVKVVSEEEANRLAQRERERELDRYRREREKEYKARAEAKAKELTGTKLLDLINKNYKSTYATHSIFKHFVSSNHESSEIKNLRLIGQQFGDNPISFDEIESSLGLRTGCSAVFGQKHRLKLWRGEAQADNSATDQFISQLKQYKL